jgi:tRNA U34 2-thiouridine synthase MnmA/TrmU
VTKRKVLVLTSGGLDSLLAMKIMEKAGLDVTGIHFRTWFTIPRYRPLEDYEPESLVLGIPVVTMELSEEFTPIVLKPRYGYGKALNPCIDCKIFFLRKAGEYARRIGADFVATGEVLGQRPMTQNPQMMRLIEKKSGLEGYLLRPLSAGLLAPTEPERLGWVRREGLYSISGRGRTEQMKLAAVFGIDRYPTPAGGCHLTDKELHRRFQEVSERAANVGVRELFVLRYGRHFTLAGGRRLVIGRNEQENLFLAGMRWGNVKLDATHVPGPLSLMDWDGRISSMKRALSLVSRYCDAVPGRTHITVKLLCGGKERGVRVPQRTTPR